MALTAKQEAFAQAIVSGMTQSDAYRTAYNAGKMKATSINVNASKLCADANIAQRVAELRIPVAAEAQEKMVYGLVEAMNEAAEALAVSRGVRNGGAMINAVTLRAKLNGLLIERKEIKHSMLHDLDDDALHKLLVQKAREAGIALHCTEHG